MAAVTAIYNHYILNSTVCFCLEAFGTADMMKAMTEIYPRYPYLVAEMDGKVAGFCYAHPWKQKKAYSHTWETTIYVAPDATGSELGHLLMKHLVGESRKMGCRVMIACITGENSGSRHFHESIGFRKVSHFEKVGYKFGRYLDVCDYQLDL